LVTPSSILMKLIFFAGYPTLCALFVLLGLGNSWHPLIVIFAAGMILPMIILLDRPIGFKSSNSYAVHIFMICAFVFSLIMSDYPGTGAFIDGIAFLIFLYLLMRLKLLDRLVNIEHKRTYVFYWFIYILSTSIPTSLGLARLKYLVNLIPIFLFVMIFGWFGPEVTYRIMGGVYGALKAIFLELAFFLMVVMLYSSIFGDIYPMMKPLIPDGFWVYSVVIIALPSMLISRIILEFLKTT